jgi:hypothetical protein
MRVKVGNVLEANPKDRGEMIATIIIIAMILITTILIAQETKPVIVIIPYGLRQIEVNLGKSR